MNRRVALAPVLVLGVLGVLVGCGDVGGGSSDAAPLVFADAPVGAVDAPPGTSDATLGAIDASPVGVDATPGAVDGGSTCGKVGLMCTDPAMCGDTTMLCWSGGGGGVCAPNRPGCGGFAGAMCGPAAPHCMFLAGGDFGPCLTADEKACACAGSPGAFESTYCP